MADSKPLQCVAHNELLIRIDSNVINLTKNFKEFKNDVKDQQKKQDAKLSAHDKQFGEVDVRMTKQNGQIITGKFWKTFLVVVIAMGTIFGGLAAWMKG